ncbi:phasin family protein [candidate division WOR-3 bacterium]|nr:phasin family protein [candidate division WOR-3 bacterium]MCK4330309.1 phasin family protein [candidate division WOR-3 bacterium]
MKKTLEGLMLAGLGAFILTKEKAEKFVDELEKKGKATKIEHPDIVKTILEKGTEVRKEIEKIVEKTVMNIHKKLNVPTREDLEILSRRIATLEKKLKK